MPNEDVWFRVVTIIGEIIIGGAGLTALFLFFDNKRKLKAETSNVKEETKNLIAEQYYKLTERLAEERDDLLARINRNNLLIKELETREQDNKKIIDELIKETELCKLQHQSAELEMKQLKHLASAHILKRDLVIAVDDDIEVIEEFRHNFAKSSVLDFSGYIDYDAFIKELKRLRPPLVILDYHLSGGKTAEDILWVIDNELRYKPEIFIMSGGHYDWKFKNKDNITFFLKEPNFVTKISYAILKHLTEKL